jgi:hypothetical protein
MNKLLESALEYREMGFSVIPLVPGDKFPPKDFEVVQYRTRIATVDEIKAWWKKEPRYNVGIVTGKLSNIFVVDHDKYKDIYSEETALEYIPDHIVTATATSPRGGEHQYFTYESAEGLTIKSGFAPGMDYKGEGGYITAPPSVNGSQNPYAWVGGLELGRVELARLPSAFINKISNSIYRDVTFQRDNAVTGVTSGDIWANGTRDENLFRVSFCLAKTYNDKEYIRQTLRAIVWSWGERDEAWIDAKVKSAMNRLEDQEKNMQDRFDAFVRDIGDDFSVTQLDKELHIVTPRDMASRRQCVKRRKDKTIEKVPNRPGWFRPIETELEFLDFDEPEEIEHPLVLPFQLNSLVKICQGNIIVSAGEYNSGKTTFALNCLVMNKNRMPIRYLSSEMKVGEIKTRFRLFGVDKEQWWPDENCQYLPIKKNLTSLLLPDGLNIIDYLEFPDGDYTMAGEIIKQIHDKLRTGVVVVCIQKKEGQRLPRSGDLVLEKPRLAITFTKIANESDNVVGIAEVLKAKNVRLGKMDGKRLKYEIVKNGSTFKTITNWGWWR